MKFIYPIYFLVLISIGYIVNIIFSNKSNNITSPVKKSMQIDTSNIASKSYSLFKGKIIVSDTAIYTQEDVHIIVLTYKVPTSYENCIYHANQEYDINKNNEIKKEEIVKYAKIKNDF